MLSEQSLQLIDIVSHLGSFTAAANKLHKVPSAVSYAIKQIEEELGVVLFERHHRSVSLTPAGAHFVKEARIMLKQLDDLKRETQRVANGWQPTLSIALDNIVRADRISVLIADFYRHFTDVELIIRIEVFNGVWEPCLPVAAMLPLAPPLPSRSAAPTITETWAISSGHFW